MDVLGIKYSMFVLYGMYITLECNLFLGLLRMSIFHLELVKGAVLAEHLQWLVLLYCSSLNITWRIYLLFNLAFD